MNKSSEKRKKQFFHKLKEHDGTIEVESGEGTIFVIEGK